MNIITTKPVVKRHVDKAMETYMHSGLDALVEYLQANLLLSKVRFPLLEYAAQELYAQLPEKQHVPMLDKVIALKTIGGNVLAGMVLQLRLEAHFSECIKKATEFIIYGDEWYVCDIIGERVLGHALLTMPEQTLPVSQKLAKHDSKWMVRSVGVATHYAVKKGLKKQYVAEMFALLLTLADTTEFHTKRGVGWAAKTIAKFHPDIIEQYSAQIDSNTVKQWFKTKIGIGLGRTAKYANRYTG